MKISAQGYALLNQKLNPHIAVLEGGYSIQGALPYVNSGIALAMAGLDYSKLREPDYNAAALRQDKRITDYIARASDAAVERYFSPTHSSQFRPGTFAVEERNIFYDTDGIQEQRKDSVLICEECAGLLVIETLSSLNRLSLCIEIPVGACDRCRDEGLLKLERGRKQVGYQHIKLINRRDKVYLP
jgi:hypothetical protein